MRPVASDQNVLSVLIMIADDESFTKKTYPHIWGRVDRSETN